MPELPEVEIIARYIDRTVKGRRIVSATLLRERLAPETPPSEFSRHLAGSAINYVHRRGKHILFDLSGGKTLLVHLRMSGRFTLLAAGGEDPKFTHAVFNFDDEERLVFDDQRHFGLMKVVSTSDLHKARELAKLAPEPFSEAFSVAYLVSTLRGSRRTLKEFLIDQTKVCGLGNIYACEAMFAAGLSPAKPANKLSKAKATRLYESIIGVLELALAQVSADIGSDGGSYFSGGGDEGWAVYDREDKPCRNCQTPIVRLKQGGRSTYFCRRCQRG